MNDGPGFAPGTAQTLRNGSEGDNTRRRSTVAAVREGGEERPWGGVPGAATAATVHGRPHAPADTENDSGSRQGALPIKYLLFI